jgi:MtN3 and saliva related transmembrane protein
MSATNLLGVWCLVFSIAFIWPQAFRVVRHNTPHGVSPIGTVHAIAGSTQWFVFGWMIKDFPVFLGNGSYVAAQFVIASVLLRHKVLTPYLLAGGTVIAVALALTAATISSSAVGVLAILISTTSIIPLTYHVYRTENLHGLSVVSLSITMVSVSSWFLYGIALQNLVLIIPNTIFMPCVAYMLISAIRWHNAHPSPAAV